MQSSIPHVFTNSRYFTVLHQGKTNRWLLRFQGDKKSPTITLPLPMTDERKREITRSGLQVGTGDSIQIGTPENLMRIAGLIFDAYAYCRDDANFRRNTGTVPA